MCFVNRRRTMLKVLGCEPGGYWIWAKRLEAGLFAPVGVSGAVSRTSFLAFLDGMDVFGCTPSPALARC